MAHHSHTHAPISSTPFIKPLRLLADTHTPRSPKPTPCTGQTPQRITSAALLGQSRLLEIAHDGSVYQLRLTASGKLILTK